MCLSCGFVDHVYDVTVNDSAGSATSSGSGATLVAANGQFDIVINYSGNATYHSAFNQAAARWMQVNTADIPDFNSSQYGLIDDLRIDASVAAIDGQGGILGQAGPDVFRPGSRLPAHGTMQFDSADIAQMYANGRLVDVIMHEIVHILGIGTLWAQLGLKNSAGDYIGARGLDECRTLTGNFSASSVPIEHDGGSGTAGAHWDEETFNAELMTGFVEAPGTANPLSRLTNASLQDMGYTVNYAVADVYSLPGGGAIVGTEGNDVLTGTGSGDSIAGCTGDDTAVFSGNLQNYALTDLGRRVLVSGPDGSDTVFNNKHFRFADDTINPDDGSGVFDTIFYHSTYLDVFRVGANALSHYMANGWREGRDPSLAFDTDKYLAANPDVKAVGVNPLQHFLQNGIYEGRLAFADNGW